MARPALNIFSLRVPYCNEFLNIVIMVVDSVLLIPAWFSLHINCGGKALTMNGSTLYDDDSDGSGQARFHRSETNWVLSSTGYFLDRESGDYYTWTNDSTLSMTNAELYMNARVSPLSLSYYGFCLGNGNYTVKLHFAEIMFTDDKTYNSLGRRVFDVYIQVNCHIILLRHALWSLKDLHLNYLALKS